jgi:hypothetical protein
MDRVEKRLDATLKIVQTGMKMLVKMERENREFRKDTHEAIHALIDSHMRTDGAIHALNESQMRTEAIVMALGIKIDRFVDSLGTGRNGSNGSKGGGRRN